MSDSGDFKGLRSQYATSSQTNAQDYQITQKLRGIYTNFLGIVKSCDSKEEQDGSGYVSAVPAVAQTDATGKSLPMAEIPKCPHYRVQQGIAALIIDPVEGDIGVFCAPKADSTTVNKDTTTPQRAGSLREFNQSNSFMVGSVHTKKPEVWIKLTQDKTIQIYAPEGINAETSKDFVQVIGQNNTITIGANLSITVSGNATITASNMTINAPTTTITGNVVINGSLSQGSGGGDATFNGNVSASGDVTAGGISLQTHVHGGVEAGGSNTTPPI